MGAGVAFCDCATTEEVEQFKRTVCSMDAERCSRDVQNVVFRPRTVWKLNPLTDRRLEILRFRPTTGAASKLLDADREDETGLKPVERLLWGWYLCVLCSLRTRILIGAIFNLAWDDAKLRHR